MRHHNCSSVAGLTLLVLSGICVTSPARETDRLPPAPSRNQAKVIAEYECLRAYGSYALFDTLTYWDADDRPSVHVFVFQKGSQFRDVPSLREHIEQLAVQAVATRSRMALASKRGDPSWRDEHRSLLELYDSMWLSDCFATVYVSATTTRSPIPERREGLPEAYTHTWLARERYYQNTGVRPSRERLYYFGPGHIYYGGSGDERDILFSVYDTSREVTRDALSINGSHARAFRRTAADLDTDRSAALQAQWQFFLELAEGAPPHEPGVQESRERASNILANVPDFRQHEWTDPQMMPATRSCGVMAVGSVFGCHDQRGYWNLADLAYHASGTFLNRPGFSGDTVM